VEDTYLKYNTSTSSTR